MAIPANKNNFKFLYFVLIFILIFASDICFALDWMECLEYAKEGNFFVEKLPDGTIQIQQLTDAVGDSSYIFTTGEDFDVSCDNLDVVHNCEVALFKFDNGIWGNAEGLEGQLEQGKNAFNLQLNSEGLYKVNIELVNGSKDIFLIVCDNMTKSLFAFFNEIRKDLENNPDIQLYKSSLLQSHIKNFLENIPQVYTSDKIYELKQLVDMYRDYKEGKPLGFLEGINKFKFRRFPGSKVMQFYLRVPEQLDKSGKLPFVYHPDFIGVAYGSEYSYFKKNLTLWCTTVTYEEYYWNVFLAVYDLISQQFNLDRDRSYLVGSCGNGIISMSMAFEHPDFWAASYYRLGNARRHLTCNAYNMFTRYSHTVGHQGQPENDGWYYFMTKCFEYSGSPNVNIDIKEIDLDDNIIDKSIVCNNSPEFIHYRAESLKNGEYFWFKINARRDENLIAEVKAKIIDKSIYVEIDNIEAFSIDFEQAPTNSDVVNIFEVRELDKNFNKENLDGLIVNKYTCNLRTNEVVGTHSDVYEVGVEENKVFKKFPKKNKSCKYFKNSSLSGGIEDAFNQRFAVFYESNKNDDNYLTSFAGKIANGAPCFSNYSQVSEYSMTHNLVVIGDFREFNLLPEKIRSEIPFKIGQNYLKIDGQEYSGDIGIVAIYPNPLNSEKYIILFVENGEKAGNSLDRVFRAIKDMQEFDVGVFKVDKDCKIDWLFSEKLDAAWQYHNHYNDELVTVDKFPVWRWRSWRADVLRRMMGADVAICENCFKFNSAPKGKLTVRDICHSFQNTWMVKVEIKGDQLKKMVLAPFVNSEEKSALLEINGVSLLKTNKGDDIYLEDIELNKTYTLVCPEKCLNGARIGVVPRNYKIVDDDYAVPLLIKYLDNKVGSDLSNELLKYKLKIY